MKDSFSEYETTNSIYGLPKSHWDCHLHTFENPKPSLVKAVDDFIQKIDNEEASRLILTGEQGRGKTHLAIGLHRHLVAKRDASYCHYISVPSFVSEIKKGYGEGGSLDLFEDIKTAQVIVLDDIFGIDDKHLIEYVVPRLIIESYDDRKSLIVTSNYSLNDMSGILHPHEMSRLSEGAIHVKMQSNTDRRLG